MFTLLMKDPLPPEVDLEADLADEPHHGHVPAPSGNGEAVAAATV
jgi:hypothetical protein